MMRLVIALPAVFASIHAMAWAADRGPWTFLGAGVLAAAVIVGAVLWVDRDKG